MMISIQAVHLLPIYPTAAVISSSRYAIANLLIAGESEMAGLREFPNQTKLSQLGTASR